MTPGLEEGKRGLGAKPPENFFNHALLSLETSLVENRDWPFIK